MSRIYLFVGSFLLLSLSATVGGSDADRGQNGISNRASEGGGIAFCCASRINRGSPGFHGSDCVVIGNNPRSINACLDGDQRGPGDISAGCLSGTWSCDPFVDENGNNVKNCCCEPLAGEGTGTCLNDLP